MVQLENARGSVHNNHDNVMSQDTEIQNTDYFIFYRRQKWTFQFLFPIK